MRHQNNFSSAHGLNIPNKGEFKTMPYNFYNPAELYQSEKPYLISAAMADKISKVIGVTALFCALFLIGLNA